MFIYDSLSIAFVRRAEMILREILHDIGIPLRRSRFLFENYTYPINVVVYDGAELGHFNAPYLQIALNRRLIFEAKTSVIRDILKHELAHYLTYINFGEVQPHGPEFHSICRRYGFPPEIARATMDLAESNLSKEGDIAAERVLEKVKKLLKLAQSSNAHEAELATLKANELLLRHNLEHFDPATESTIYLDRILAQKRKDPKLVAIYDILKHFIVKTVMSFGKETCCLEVSGTLTNVKLARYVAEFLYRELDHLWQEAQKTQGLRGLRAKNSFFSGVAKGFDEKMKLSKHSFSSADQRALVLVEQKLSAEVRAIYRRLSQARSGQGLDPAARAAGIERGRALSIRQGVEGKGKNLYLPE